MTPSLRSSVIRCSSEQVWIDVQRQRTQRYDLEKDEGGRFKDPNRPI